MIRFLVVADRPEARVLRGRGGRSTDMAGFQSGGYDRVVDALDGTRVRQAALSGLTEAQQAWAVRSEAMWRRAHAVVAEHPGLDPSDIYHALRCLELTPSQRLAAGLHRGRLRAHSR
jgi:hypothetical protein